MVAGDSPRHPRYAQVAYRARHRCEYCLAPEEFSNKEFQVEHVVPSVRGGRDTLDNLALACVRCNLSKAAALVARLTESDQDVLLFNPRLDDWSECFGFVLIPNDERVLIEGQNDTGRVTVARLRMKPRMPLGHAGSGFWRTRSNRSISRTDDTPDDGITSRSN